MLGGRYFTTSLFSRNPFKSRSAHKENKIQNKSRTKIQNSRTATWDEPSGAICVRKYQKYKKYKKEYKTMFDGQRCGMSLAVPFVWEHPSDDHL